MRYIVQNIKLPFETPREEALHKAGKRLLTYFSKDEIKSLDIFKQSVDARRRDSIMFVWSVSADVESRRIPSAEKLAADGIIAEKQPVLTVEHGNEKLSSRPVIVGFGPCGMFCALILAENGYRPIVIERGSDVKKRTADVESFYSTGVLNPESNIQFGAGGAGTFSDGKLVTRINDEKCQVVIDTFHKFGAPDEILFKAKPHIGTDYLKTTTENIRKEIERLGGEVRFDTKMLGIISSGGKISGIKTNKGDIGCGALVLAIGHSARDTFSSLMSSGVTIIPKPFSVGMRIEHLQTDIDRALYGNNAGNPVLPKGEYNFSHRCDGERGVYTFCMCPGGEVVAAASENGGVVTNGMSRFARDGRNANSAIAVSVLPSDFGNSVEGAIAFQRKIEKAAYEKCGGDYSAPACTVGDFLDDRYGSEYTKVVPTYMNGNVKMTGFGGVLPGFVISSVREGIMDFDRKIRGFADREAVLIGPETRTSSPVRITRNDSFVTEEYDNLYPCGEGAGYAGGITSAGVDGINCALKLMARYMSVEK